MSAVAQILYMDAVFHVIIAFVVVEVDGGGGGCCGGGATDGTIVNAISVGGFISKIVS